MILVSIGLAALGIVWFLKTSSRKYLNYFKKIRGVNNFFFWLILSNIFFYIYASVEILTYNLVIVKSKHAEVIYGSAGGYLVPEDLAIKYSELGLIIFSSTLIINFSISILGYFFKNKHISQQQIPENKLNLIHSFGLIIISLTTSIISLMLLVSLFNLSVSYGG
jgi:hypothetical protein